MTINISIKSIPLRLNPYIHIRVQLIEINHHIGIK